MDKSLSFELFARNCNFQEQRQKKKNLKCTTLVTESELQITVLIERNLITKMAMYMDRGKEYKK